MIKEIKIEPDQSVIDHCESLLEQAKSGDLRQLAYVMVLSGNNTNSSWTTSSNTPCTLGELSILRARIEKLVLDKYHSDDDEINQ